MPNKPKFKPEITRVKLNPEQAVLSCNCFTVGGNWASENFRRDGVLDAVCIAGMKAYTNAWRCVLSGGVADAGHSVSTVASS